MSTEIITSYRSDNSGSCRTNSTLEANKVLFANNSCYKALSTIKPQVTAKGTRHKTCKTHAQCSRVYFFTCGTKFWYNYNYVWYLTLWFMVRLSFISLTRVTATPWQWSCQTDRNCTVSPECLRLFRNKHNVSCQIFDVSIFCWQPVVLSEQIQHWQQLKRVSTSLPLSPTFMDMSQSMSS